jgi:hypothetical protein
MTRVIVAGAVANKPYNGGEAWVRLSWVLGLRRLGLDVWLIEQIAPEICRDRAGQPAPLERSANLSWFELVLERFGLGDRAALIWPDGSSAYGPTSDELLDAVADADLLVNISGNLSAEPLLRLPERRAYVDLDPGYTQCWHISGALGEALEDHEHLFTVGLSTGRPSCAIPTAGLKWHPVVPPVVLDQWPCTNAPPRSRFTTVASWRGGYGALQHDGHTYGQKAHEFRRFAGVAQQSSAAFEVALDIHPEDRADTEMLRSNGWTVVDPGEVASSPDSYRRYIQQSAGEFSPAQGLYVEMASGWFSDRTTRYLASGRPAVVQDTAFSGDIPVGEGLLAFRTVEEAVAGVDDVLADYGRHSRAARRLAEERFDSDVVLGGVLEDVLP